MSKELDGCDVDLTKSPTPDGELDYVVLFAEALDSSTGVTVEQRVAEWKELL